MALSVAVTVGDEVADALIEAIVPRAAEIKTGDGMDRASEMGPLITRDHCDKVRGYLDRGVEEGAELILDGRSYKPDQGFEDGYWVGPSLFDKVTSEMSIYTDEIFGPVLPVIPFDDGDDIIAWANESRYGLASYVFTNDITTADECAERLEYGSICVNEPWYSVELPHGGLKQSGIGKDCSALSLEEHFDVKRVTTRVKA